MSNVLNSNINPVLPWTIKSWGPPGDVRSGLGICTRGTLDEGCHGEHAHQVPSSSWTQPSSFHEDLEELTGNPLEWKLWLDSILKSRDITLLTKVHPVKAMVFPVVMYGYESWTIKKAECRRIDAFELWCWRRLWESLGLQGDPTSPF